MKELEDKIAQLMQQLPPVSIQVKEGLVKYIPWVMIGFSALGIVLWLQTIAVMGAVLGGMAIPLMILSLLAPVMQLLGLAGGYFMLQRQRRGWLIAFYSLLLGAVVNLLGFNLVGLAIDLLLLYFLFQIRDSYTC